TASPAQLQPYLGVLKNYIDSMLTATVPEPIAETHLNILNAAQGVYQLLSEYDPSNDDPLIRMSVTALLNDYMQNIALEVDFLRIYFSSTLNPSGYIN